MRHCRRTPAEQPAPGAHRIIHEYSSLEVSAPRRVAYSDEAYIYVFREHGRTNRGRSGRVRRALLLPLLAEEGE